MREPHSIGYMYMLYPETKLYVLFLLVILNLHLSTLLNMSRYILTKIDVSKRTTANFSTQSILASHTQLHSHKTKRSEG